MWLETESRGGTNKLNRKSCGFFVLNRSPGRGYYSNLSGGTYFKTAVPEGYDIQVPLGAQFLDKTSQNSINIEEFLAGMRFDQRGKLEELPISL